MPHPAFANRNWIGRFLDGFGGHRLYILGALGFVLACVLWGMGRVDTGAWCMAVGTIGAFIGGNELTGAVRDRANLPPAPEAVAITTDGDVNQTASDA